MEPGIDTVVSEAYVTGLSDLSLGEVRARRETARHLENAVSYVRRLAHGRLDIIAAEIGRRGESADALDLVSTLRASLGAGVPARSGAELGLPSRAPQELDPAEEADPFVADLDAAVSTGFVAGIGESSDRELAEALGRLKVFEESISARRRALHANLDQLQAELVAALAHAGVCCTVYVRRWAADLPDVVAVEPGVRVVHVTAGDPALAKEDLPAVVDEFTRGVIADIVDTGGTDVVHANYWLSGVAGHAIKHELDLPLVSTFHTLARVKAENGDPEPGRRVAEETRVVACSDRITASCVAEAHQLCRLYGAPRDRIELVAPGVDHGLFSPGDRGAARRALGLDGRPTLLFVGRIQPLKGLDVAVEALAALDDRSARLVVVGGPSGPDGEAESARVRRLVAGHGLDDRVVFVPPQPHHRLSTYYRAADLCVVPSRSESFGLVALEASACGTPVVAAAVGGLRTLVAHGRTGFLVESRDPARYAAFIDEILANPIVAAEMAMDAAASARAYTWSTTAERLVGVYRELTSSQLVDCAM